MWTGRFCKADLAPEPQLCAAEQVLLIFYFMCGNREMQRGNVPCRCVVKTELDVSSQFQKLIIVFVEE